MFEISFQLFCLQFVLNEFLHILNCLFVRHFVNNFIQFFYVSTDYVLGGTRWPSWLRHCVTSQKVTGSIPDGVIGIFHLT